MFNLAVSVAVVMIGVAAGIVVYRDARMRDYYPIVWGLLFPLVAIFGLGGPSALVLMPVAGLIYVLVRPKGKMSVCPHCSRPSLDWLAFCPLCTKPKKRECLKCHDLAEWKDTRCPHCGVPMPPSTGEQG